MIYTAAKFGYETPLVEVESVFKKGVPAIDIIGVADEEVNRARISIKFFLEKAGFSGWLTRYILLSLSPADIRKSYDDAVLPMALEILRNERRIEAEGVFAYGSLMLDGSLLPLSGTYAALQTAAARGMKYAIVPQGGEPTPSGIEVFRAKNLAEAFAFIEGGGIK